MSRILDSALFTLLRKQLADDHEIQEYACKWPESTIVLYSRKDEPLAAVTFMPERARSLVTCYRGENRFAALASTDECAYSFALTNLTHVVRPRGRRHIDEGMLKIDLLLDDEPVREVDMPMRALNQWNEFSPSTTGIVRGDQRRGNRELLLTGIVDARGAAVSVAADAAASRGTSVRVHVTASDAFPELIEALRGSVWRPAEVIVRALKTPHHSDTPYRQANVFMPSGLISKGGIPHAMVAQGRSFAMSSSSSSSSRGGQSFAAVTGQSQAMMMPPPSAPRAFGASAAGSRSVVLQRGAPVGGDLSLNSSTLLGQSYPYPPPSVSSSSSSRGGQSFGVVTGQSQATMMPPPSAASAVDVPSTVTIDDAQAARLDVGTRRILVNTEDTYVTYDYDAPGARALLTLALWPAMPAYDTLAHVDARAYTSRIARELAQRLSTVIVGDSMNVERVFVADTCVVCTDAEPTMLIARCGHQCLCTGCAASAGRIATCYVCRGRVTLVFSAAGLATLIND